MFGVGLWVVFLKDQRVTVLIHSEHKEMFRVPVHLHFAIPFSNTLGNLNFFTIFSLSHHSFYLTILSPLHNDKLRQLIKKTMIN